MVARIARDTMTDTPEPSELPRGEMQQFAGPFVLMASGWPGLGQARKAEPEPGEPSRNRRAQAERGAITSPVIRPLAVKRTVLLATIARWPRDEHGGLCGGGS
ncbi:hypothetical protein ABIB73_007432 [Bradyrhizobium sp. F1.4.3]|uniref:hypothetical protein n=1 Tax=Bradyrhizobium sp. F1.4.3 TaxID=3156356 RepID=UPI0033979AE1